MYEESLAILRLAGSAAHLAYTLGYSGYTIWCLGDVTTARGRYDESLAIYQTLGDRAGIATALVMQGLWAHRAGDYRTARIHFEQALGLFRTVGDRRSIARTVRNLADVALARANYADALELYDQSLIGFRQLSDKYFIAHACGVRIREWAAGAPRPCSDLPAQGRAAFSDRRSVESMGLVISSVKVHGSAGLGEAAFAAALPRARLTLEDAIVLARQNPAVPEAAPLAPPSVALHAGVRRQAVDHLV